MAILEVHGLTKQYKEALAVNDISFSIEKGEIFALIGPNGASKTTTIRMLTTLINPSSGDATIDGHSIKSEPARVRECITYLPDEAGAYKTMTGTDYLKFMADIYAHNKDESKKFVEKAKTICKLGDRLEQKMSTYSRGMIRKLLLARAIMTAPKLAVLDEPTSGLDVINALEIRKMIKEIAHDEGTAFLLSSHNMLEIEYVSDRVGIISKGNLMVVGTPQELKEEYKADNLEEVFERVVLSDEVC